MNGHFMGAINKTTGRYENPRIATKNNKYSCPDCKRDVILKKGDIKAHHFSHKASENPCRNYNNPGESQIHKDAKLLLKSLLENKKNLCFKRNCICCNMDDLIDTINEYSDTVKIINEYRFNFNDSNKSADVAYLENDTLKYIFEICYRHKTLTENRPEPWYEINAEELQNNIDIINNKDVINIVCNRKYKCNGCFIREKYEQEQLEIRLLEIKKLKEEKEEKERKEYEENERLRLETKKIEDEKQRKKEENEYKEREEKQRVRLEMIKIEDEKQREKKRKLQERKEKLSLEREEYLDKIKNEYSIKQEEVILKEQEKINFMNSFSKEDKDKAYTILKDKLDKLKYKIFSIHKCNRCKFGRRCKLCYEVAEKEYNKLRINIPTIEYILTNLESLSTNTTNS